ncbi:MAG: hypothetical protein E5Y52_08160 [Mesorhizobium sp.]|nr:MULTISPECIES: hypothetical protein [unclassified Mesorhizobium]TIM68641.1 MAG: hypothetical protein E5Y52_08160 [Mesorhizobium sp.]
MALHLVGENIDKTRSHYQAETGKLVQLMRGIYVDAGEDIEATILKHAVRIANTCIPTLTSRRRALCFSARPGMAACS